jgi:hypothetical protein
MDCYDENKQLKAFIMDLLEYLDREKKCSGQAWIDCYTRVGNEIKNAIYHGGYDFTMPDEYYEKYDDE